MTEQEEFEFRDRLEREQASQSSSVSEMAQAKSIPMYPQMSEKDKINHPILSGINQAGNNLATIAYKGAEGLTLGGGFGLVDSLLKKQGISKPEFNFDNMPTTDQSVLKLSGDIANLGGAGKTLGTIAGKIGDVSNATGLTKLLSNGVNKTTGAVKRVIDSFKGASAADLEAKLAQRKTDIANEKLNLEGLFKQKYKDITFKGKQVVPEISKGMSNAYEQGLDDIFSKLDDPLQASSILKKNAPPITNTELVNKLDDLVTKSANDPLIIKSDAYKMTVRMLDDFKNGSTSESGLLDSSGNIIKTSRNEAVDIRDLIAKVRDIKSTIKASSLEGSTPISGQDYFATQFNKTIGGLLKDRVEGFKELQASYAPMAQTRKVAYKIFKPFSDEDSTLAFLQRIKNDTMKSSDEKLLKFLQEGGVVGDKKIPGMGQFAPELKNIGATLKKLNSGIEEKQLAADIFKKASDEKFRNRVFLWTLGTIGLGTGTKKAADLVISH